MAAKKRTFLKVLVVDDILYVVKSISRVLTAEGFFVLTARTGQEALKKYEEYTPDLVTVDQQLPDMSGRELVEQIRKIDTKGDTRIISISAITDRQEIKAVLEQGIDDYLVKPFTKNRLIETVQKLIGSAKPKSDEPE